MNVKFLQINEREFPISFGYSALMRFEEKTGKKAFEVLNTGSITDLFTLTYYALCEGLRIAKRHSHPTPWKEVPSDIYAISDLVDTDTKAMTRLNLLMAEAFPEEDDVEEIETEVKAGKPKAA